jgi:hypothetical protein
VESEVLADATTTLPRVLQAVLGPDKTSFGFAPGDQLSGITMTDPFRISIINASTLQEYESNRGVSTLGSFSAELWYSILLCDDQPRSLITIAKEGTKWAVVSLDPIPEVSDMYDLLKQYGNQGVQFMWFPALHRYLFHLPNDKHKNLTLIPSGGEGLAKSPSNGIDTNQLSDADSTVQLLQQKLSDILDIVH